MKKTLVIVGLLVLVSTLALAVFKYEIPWQKEHLTADPSGRITLSKSFVFKVLPESTENGTEIWVGHLQRTRRCRCKLQRRSVDTAHVQRGVPVEVSGYF